MLRLSKLNCSSRDRQWATLRRKTPQSLMLSCWGQLVEVTSVHFEMSKLGVFLAAASSLR